MTLNWFNISPLLLVDRSSENDSSVTIINGEVARVRRLFLKLQTVSVKFYILICYEKALVL